MTRRNKQRREKRGVQVQKSTLEKGAKGKGACGRCVPFLCPWRAAAAAVATLSFSEGEMG